VRDGRAMSERQNCLPCRLVRGGAIQKAKESGVGFQSAPDGSIDAAVDVEALPRMTDPGKQSGRWQRKAPLPAPKSEARSRRKRCRDRVETLREEGLPLPSTGGGSNLPAGKGLANEVAEGAERKLKLGQTKAS